jgi:hypothetical protein
VNTSGCLIGGLLPPPDRWKGRQPPRGYEHNSEKWFHHVIVLIFSRYDLRQTQTLGAFRVVLCKLVKCLSLYHAEQKKSITFIFLQRSSLWMNFKKVLTVWKWVVKKWIVKTIAVWSFYVLRTFFQTAVTSKRMVGKGPGWFLRLIELFPDLT